MASVKTVSRFRRLISILLAMSVLVISPVISFAEDDNIPEPLTRIDPDSIQKMVDRYFAENDLNPDLISIGYIYTGSGDSWYHNGDQWYYSASLYKVPLMMLYAEKEAAGELTQDSEFFGMPLSYLEDEILTFSNNDLAYSMMLNLADPFACRLLFCAFADLPEEYYTWEFTGYSYFSARFMTSVMYTLFRQPERFPGIVERLKNAQPEHYFRMSLESTGVEVAQKYGNYHDEDGNDWNHTAGIIFTEVPFLLTVMTRYGGISENIIADLAQLFYDYSLTLDVAGDPLQDHIQMNSDQAAAEISETGERDSISEGTAYVAEAAEDEDDVFSLPDETESALPAHTDVKMRLILLTGSSACVLILILCAFLRKGHSFHGRGKSSE